MKNGFCFLVMIVMFSFVTSGCMSKIDKQEFMGVEGLDSKRPEEAFVQHFYTVEAVKTKKSATQEGVQDSVASDKEGEDVTEGGTGGSSMQAEVKDVVVNDDEASKTKIEHRRMQTLVADYFEGQADAQKERKDLKKGTSNIKRYVSAGIALSDEACSNWFQRQYSIARDMGYDQGNLNTVGDMIMAGMGLAESDPTGIGAVALAFGGLNSVFENTKGSFLLTDTWPKLEKKVLGVREELAKGLKKGVDSYDYFEARGLLRKYHDTCSLSSLAQLIDDSVGVSKYVPAKSEVNIADSGKVLRSSREMFKIIYPGEEGLFSSSNLYEMYIVLFGGETKTAASILSNNLYMKDLLAKDASTPHVPDNDGLYYKIADDSDRNKFNLYLNQIGEVLGFPERLQEIRMKEAEIETAKAETEEAEGELSPAQPEDLEDGARTVTPVFADHKTAKKELAIANEALEKLKAMPTSFSVGISVIPGN